MNNIAQIFKTDKFKTTIISIAFRTKANYDNISKNNLLSKIFSVSSNKYNTNIKLKRKLEEMNGAVFDVSVIKKGNENIILFYLEVLTLKESNLIEELNFLKEFIYNPLVDDDIESFDKIIFEREKSHLISDIKNRKDKINEYVLDRCIEEMYGKKGFGLNGIGYLDSINNINSRNLYIYYKELLKKSAVEIIIVGNVNIENVKNYLRENFIDLLFRKLHFDFDKEIFNDDYKEIFEKSDLKQGKLCIGFKSGICLDSDNFIPFLIFNEILGATPNSRLFLEVREKNGLCYYINSFIYKFKGTMIIQAGIDSNNYNDTIEIIKNIFEETRKNIKDNEILNAKNSLIKIFNEIYDDLPSICDNILNNIIIGNYENIFNIDNYIESINKCNKEQILFAANKLKLDTIYFLSD